MQIGFTEKDSYHSLGRMENKKRFTIICDLLFIIHYYKLPKNT